MVGNFGLGLAAVVAFLITGLALAALFFVFSFLGTIGIGVWFLIAIPMIAILAVVFAALDGIYKAALYVFASTGEVPSLFPTEVVREGFREDTRGGSIGGPGGRF